MSKRSIIWIVSLIIIDFIIAILSVIFVSVLKFDVMSVLIPAIGLIIAIGIIIFIIVLNFLLKQPANDKNHDSNDRH